MKKLLAIILALSMVLSMAACGSDSNESSNSGEANDADSSNSGEVAGASDVYYAPADTSNLDQDILNSLPHYKFAFSYYAFTDKLSQQFRGVLDYLGEAFNVEFVYFESGNGDEAVTNIESVLAAGDIDGVIYVGGSQAVLDVCEKYQVPFISACGFPSTETEQQGCASYSMYLGGVVDNDVWAGTRACEALYEAGCRSLCFSGLTAGLVKSHDDRWVAMKDFVAAHDDFELIADSLTMMETANDIASFAAAYTGVADCYISTGSSDSIYSALEAEGWADPDVIKYATIDISSQTGVYFKDGVQIWTCGGQYPTVMVAFAVLYNYVHDGVEMIEDNTQPLARKYIEITSYEDYENYCKYLESDVPGYTAEEIAQMMLVFNPDVTIEDLENDADIYSLEDVMTRHAGMAD